VAGASSRTTYGLPGVSPLIVAVTVQPVPVATSCPA
jgi:hypothetical protein